MTKLQNNTHNLRNMPVTTPDSVSIYPFSKKLKMELLGIRRPRISSKTTLMMMRLMMGFT